MICIKQKRAQEVKKMLCSCKDFNESNQYFLTLQDFGKNLIQNEELNDLTIFSLALSSKERMILLESLQERDRCVCELEAIIDKSQSTISHHISKLSNAGLIEGYKKGNFTYYHLVKDILTQKLDLLNRFFHR